MQKFELVFVFVNCEYINSTIEPLQQFLGRVLLLQFLVLPIMFLRHQLVSSND